MFSKYASKTLYRYERDIKLYEMGIYNIPLAMVPSQILILPTKKNTEKHAYLTLAIRVQLMGLALIIMENKLPDSLVREHFDE